MKTTYLALLLAPVLARKSVRSKLTRYSSRGCRASRLMARVCKFSAKTAAGVYSKALVLRASYGQAPRLAESLVEDLVGNPTLRAAIWPADTANAGRI